MGLLDIFKASISPKRSAVSNDQRIVDRHYKLLDQINAAYREKNYERAEKYCLEDVRLFPDFAKAYPKIYPNDHILPRITSFEILAKIYDKQGKYHKLIEICELALRYKLEDSTKGGFKARIQKAQKKI